MFRSFVHNLSFNALKSRDRCSKRSVKAALRQRLLCVEQLETRALLSVSTAEYAEIRDVYPELNLPETANALNVVEIEASNLTVANLKAAIDAAGKTTNDDLIVLRTTDEANTITFSHVYDEIEINIDSSQYGALNVVASGVCPLTINARQCSRVFNVVSGTLGMANLTITGGFAENGGGIYLNGILTTTNTTIENNYANQDGGGIYVDDDGTFTSVNTNISGNKAYWNGGGVYNYGTFTATNTTITRNFVYNCGGGVSASKSTVSITNSIVSANYASSGGGIDLTYGVLTVTNTTIAGNYSEATFSGGIYMLGSTVVAKNVVLASNYGGNINHEISSESFNNYIGYYPSFVCGPVFDENGVLTNADSLDLRLRSDSLAIDAGLNEVVEENATDLDGNARVYNGTVDIGAYEYQGNRSDAPFYSTVVNTLNDSFDLNDDEWSLREAIYYATKYETITFEENLNGVIDLTLGELPIYKALAVDGAGRIIIDAGQKSRVISVISGTDESPVVINGLTIQNGKTSDSGGGIYVKGVLKTTNTTISGNYARDGGGVDFYGKFTAINTTIADNYAESCGGGVLVWAGSFETINTTISGNSASVYGGGVWVGWAKEFMATNTVVSGNYADKGGGVYNNGTFTSINSTIAGNSATSEGGGVYVDSYRTFTAKNTLLTSNYGSNLYLCGVTLGSCSNTLLDDDPSFVCAPVFDENGKLTNANSLDLRLNSNSPAIDAGSNAAAEGITVDLDGNGRVYNGTVDIGAYEFDDSLSVPSNLTLGTYNSTTRRVSMSWTDNSTAETGFRVEYSTDGGKTWNLSQITGANVSSRVAWGVKSNANYQFRVCAVQDKKSSEWTYSPVLNTRVSTPAAPGDVTLGDYDATSRTVAMSWQDNSDSETGFRVEYSTDGGKTWRLSQIMGANVSSRVAWGVKPDMTYEFRVCALQGGIKSKWAYSETLETGVEKTEFLSDCVSLFVVANVETTAVKLSNAPVLNASYEIPTVACASTFPVVESLDEQDAVRATAFQEFTEEEPLLPTFRYEADFNSQKGGKTNDDALFVDLFDELTELDL